MQLLHSNLDIHMVLRDQFTFQRLFLALEGPFRTVFIQTIPNFADSLTRSYLGQCQHLAGKWLVV